MIRAVLLYIVLIIPQLLLVVLRYPLAVVAVLGYSSADRRMLTRFRWLETIDNDLAGDSGWREEHLVGSDPLSTFNRIRWLWRNGGNALNYRLFGCPAAPVMSFPEQTFWTRPDGYWLYRRFFKIAASRYLEVFVGWALFGPQQGRCKYVCTVRFRTKAA